MYGRQPMEELQVVIEGRELRGSGVDIFGPFSLRGIIGETGVVAIQKRYVGRHLVEYVGEFDGEGSMSGTWRIDDWEGGRWMIAITRGESDNSDHAAAEEPAEIPEFRPESQ